MSKNYYQVMNAKYKLPEKNSSPQEWNTFIKAEMTPIKQEDIDKLKLVIANYDKQLLKLKNKNRKKLSKKDKQLAQLKCEAVFHLAHMEQRKERQIKVKECMDKLVIDWDALKDDLNAIMRK